MNRHLLAGAVVLTCLCLIISESYACTTLVIDSDWDNYVGVGSTHYTIVDAWVVSGGPAYDPGGWYWTYPSEFYNVEQFNSEYDSDLKVSCDTAGKYNVDVVAWGTNGNDDDRSYVYVVEVGLVSDNAFVALYNDDEDELVQVDISLSPAELNGGDIILDASGGISVWYDSEGTNQVPIPLTWPIVRGVWPSVWVKGTSVSSEVDDASLEISYKTHWGPILHSCTVNFTVLDVEITEPDGPPDYDHQFAFEGANAICIFDVDGETGTDITALDDDLEWELEPLGDAYCEWKCEPNLPSDPYLGLGTDVTFWNGGIGGYRSTGAYPFNNDWGEKTLTLTHPESGFVDTLNLEIFFNPDVMISNIPHWFRYWGVQYDAAVPEIYDEDFEYTEESPWDDYSGVYKEETLYLCPWAPVPCEDYSDTWTNMYYKTSVNTGPDGVCDTTALSDDIQVIDVGEGTVPYAICITAGPDGWLHSNDITSYYGYHYDVDKWMMPRYGDEQWLSDDELDLTGEDVIADVEFSINATGLEKCAITCIHEMTHRDNDKPGLLDSDSDKVIDTDEINFRINGGSKDPKLDPYRLKTYISFKLDDSYQMNHDLINDNEFTAYMSQHSGSEDPTQDWSKDGEQWHK